MKLTKIMQEFEELAESIGVRIIKGKGNFAGDYCLVGDDPYIVINKNKPMEHRIKRLATAFSRLDLNVPYIKPIIRKMIDEEKDTELEGNSIKSEF